MGCRDANASGSRWGGRGGDGKRKGVSILGWGWGWVVALPGGGAHQQVTGHKG